MIDFRPIIFIVGLLLTILSCFMVIPVLADLYFSNENWQGIAFSIVITLIVGSIIMLTQQQHKFAKLNIRQAFLITTLSWVSISLASALPFYLSHLNLSFTDSLFEAVSGITTTGATIIDNLTIAAPGVLMWRSILQWLGGIGIVVMALTVLPMLQVGGMQMFRLEFSQQMEKTLPRPAQIGLSIVLIYIALTGFCLVLYWVFGMRIFDAVNHAMTTVATGGYSTHNESLAWFKNPSIHVIAIIFMILGSLPFLLFFEAIGGNVKALIKDSQVKTFLSLLLCAFLVMFLYIEYIAVLPYIESDGVRGDFIHTLFNITSVFTGTGYMTRDYSNWGSFAALIFFFLMFIGGCVGSTTCGLKIFRLQILYCVAKNQINKLFRPNSVLIASYDKRPIPVGVAESVMGFFFLYVITFAVLAALLGLTGLDFLSSTSAAASAIANVGPGLGPVVGPKSTYQSLSDGAKWIMIMGMLIGRLELFAVFVLFSAQFWKR